MHGGVGQLGQHTMRIRRTSLTISIRKSTPVTSPRACGGGWCLRKGVARRPRTAGEMGTDDAGQTTGIRRGGSAESSLSEMRQDEREWTLVRESLRAAGIDPTDFGRFVNRPVPDVIEPSSFDSATATPVLLEWLPKITDPALKQTIIGRLRNPAAKGIATEHLIAEFASTTDHALRWHAGDALQYVATKEQRPALVPLARDKRYGKGRQMLFEAIGRLKSEEALRTAREALTDPEVALHAGGAFRRLVGRDEAATAFKELADHPHPAVAQAAKQNLKRLSRTSKGSG